MNKSTRFILFMILTLVLIWPGVARAKTNFEDEVVFGGAFTLRSDETLNENLFVLGGNADLQVGSQVNGDVTLMGGNLQVAGRIEGNIMILGGNASLEETAVVTGDVSTVGGNLQRAPGAEIGGEVNSDLRRSFPFVIPSVRVGGESFGPFQLFLNLVWFLFRTFLWAALAVLVIMFLPRQVERTARTAVAAPLISGGVGLLTGLVAPLLLVILAITILLIPVSLAGAFVLVLAWAFGLVALGYEVGKRLAAALRQAWAPAVEAGIGMFVLMFIVDGSNTVFSSAGYIVPGIACLSWILPFLVGIIGLGAVLLTRFGSAPYPLTASGSPRLRGEWPPAPTTPPAPVETWVARPGPTESGLTPEEPIPPASGAQVFPVPPSGEDQLPEP